MHLRSQIQVKCFADKINVTLKGSYMDAVNSEV